MPSVLNIEVVDTLEKFKALENDWNSLLEEIPDKFIFQTYDWHYNVIQGFGREKGLFVLTIKKGNELVAIIPLWQVKRDLKFRKYKILQLLTQSRADYQEFIIKKDREACMSVLCEFLKEQKNLWDLIFFRSVRDGSQNTLMVDMFNHLGITAKSEDAFVCPVIKVDKGFEEYKKDFKAKFFSNIRRLERKINKLGAVSINKYNGEIDIEEIANEFILLHQKRWGITDTKSKFNKKIHRIYYQQLFKSLYKKKYLDLFYMKLDDRIIAVHFGTLYNNRCLFHNPAYDPDYSKFAPSKILLYHIIERCHDQKIELFDFLAGSEEYKYDWTKMEKKTKSFIAYKGKASEMIYKSLYDKNEFTMLSRFKKNL